MASNATIWKTAGPIRLCNVQGMAMVHDGDVMEMGDSLYLVRNVFHFKDEDKTTFTGVLLTVKGGEYVNYQDKDGGA